uniref:Uncharacterized protein n=1 Tax=Zea mays TaxID=4577 RepID=A0A804R2K1_MAIZE
AHQPHTASPTLPSAASPHLAAVPRSRKLQLPLEDVPTCGPAPPTTSPSPTVTVPPAGAPARRRRRRPAGAGGPPSVAGLREGRGTAGPRARVALRPVAPTTGAGPAAPPRPVPVRGADDFLRLVDAHGSFRDALVALAALQVEARVALRKEEPARLASAARAALVRA